MLIARAVIKRSSFPEVALHAVASHYPRNGTAKKRRGRGAGTIAQERAQNLWIDASRAWDVRNTCRGSARSQTRSSRLGALLAHRFVERELPGCGEGLRAASSVNGHVFLGANGLTFIKTCPKVIERTWIFQTVLVNFTSGYRRSRNIGKIMYRIKRIFTFRGYYIW